MNSELITLFQQIDDAVSTTSSLEDIDKSFKDALQFIQDKLEGEDEAEFNRAKYQYHLKKSRYLLSIGKQEESQREKNIATRHGLKLQLEQQSTDDDMVIQSPETLVFNDQIDSQQSALSYTTSAVKKCSAELKQMCSDYPNMKPLISDLESLVHGYIVDNIQSYEEYSVLDNTASKIRLILNLLKNHITTTITNESKTSTSGNVSNSDSEIAALAGAFCMTVDKCLIEYRRTFCHFLLSQKHRTLEILFSNIPFTQERIVSHARKLALLFHPDKADEVDRVDFREAFDCITLCKQKLLDELTKNGGISDRELVNRHQAEGKKLWETARDYSRARNGEWKKLVHLRESDLKCQVDKDLQQHQISYAILAYEQYRAAAIALGNGGTVEERSELRRMMAISLYTGEQFLQAQIYTIAAMHILVQATGSAQADKLKELQNLLETIRSPKTRNPTATATATPAASASPVVSATTVQSNSRELVSVNIGGLSALRMRAHIKDELRAVVVQQCLIKCKEKQVKTSEELILTAKRKAAQHRTAGVALQAGSVATATGMVLAAYSNTVTAIFVGSVFGAPGVVLAIGAGIGVLTGSLILGKNLFDKGSTLLQEPTIREKLNVTLSLALEYHKEQMYGAFLNALSIEYFPGSRLIAIEKDGKTIKIDVNPRWIVGELLAHEFRPDGVAYLLNLIGEALLNKPVLMQNANDFSSLRQPLFSTMNELAIKCFSEVFSENSSLLKRAKELDRQVQKKSLEDAEVRFLTRVMQSVTSMYSAYVYSIPNEYFTDALRTPYTTRLQELGDIARLNFAIANIIVGGTDNFEESQEAVLEVKRRQVLTAHNQFFMISETLVQAIDDLLMAFGLIPKPLVDKDVLALEDSVVLENIQKVMVNNVAIKCESVYTASTAVNQLEIFSKLSNPPIFMSQENFVQAIQELFEKNSSDKNFKTNFTEVLKADKADNLEDWNNNHCSKANWVLKAAHLPFLSELLKLTIHSCSVTIHPTDGRLFVAKDVLHTNLRFESSVFAVLDSDNTHIIGIIKTCELGLNNLYNDLETAITAKKKIEIIQNIATHYRLKAEHFEKLHRLQALPHWHEAKKSYSKILKLDPNNLDALLGFGRCLCMLSKFETGEKFLRKTIAAHPHSAEGWYLLALTKRKLHLYDEALYFIQKALDNDSSNKEAVEESNVIKALQSEKMKDRIEVYNRMTVSHKATSTDSSSDFNVLTIDGGGVRGIMPAVWLAELERRTNRSTASLFHMMSGVSTGAIVAAGLCTPACDNTQKPRYEAADIVKLYVARSNEVFQRTHSWMPNYFRQLWQDVKYTDAGRADLFSSYFENIRLSHVLTELVIPAVKSDGRQTHLFNRHDCRASIQRDDYLRDVLMCTTAAPTYFKPYILGDSHYVDGGVQMNNPVIAAYNECIRYGISRENMFILSLGTGDYVPDPLHPGANRHLLFYATHQKEILNMILDGPQYNVDVHMMSLMNKEKYQRWQVWFDKPIELDNIEQSSLELLFENARAYFEEMEAYDNDKRLGLLLDRLRGDTH